MKARTLFAAAALSAAFLTLAARAQLIAYDPFSGYSAGFLNGQGQGYGWAGNWSGGNSIAAVPASDLTYAALIGSAGLAQMNAVGYPGDGIARSFAAVSSGTVYFGALIQYNAVGGGNIMDLTFSGDNSAGNQGVVFLGQYAGNPYAQGGNITNWVDARRSDGDVPSQIGANSGLTVVAGSPTYLVGRIDFNTSGALDSIWMWVNPADAAMIQNTATANASLVNQYDLGAISMFGVYVNSGSGFLLDEVRISQSAGPMFGAVPEPSAYAAILGLCSLAALLWRRGVGA